MMCSRAKKSWASVIVPSLLFVLVLAGTSTPARSDGWRDRKIDGNSASSFESSVAALQNELPQERREEFEVALATVWIRNTVDVSDPDQNGRFDLNDLRLLKDESLALLTAIDRGNLLAALEEREKKERQYSVAQYLRDLDGLRFDDVVALAGHPSSDTYRAVVSRFQKQLACTRVTTGSRLPSCPAPTINRTTGKVLSEAVQALNAHQYAEAKSAVGTLQLDRLSPYERAKTEEVLFQVAVADKNLGEARQHLVNAIGSGGLNDDEIEFSLNAISTIDSRLGTGSE